MKEVHVNDITDVNGLAADAGGELLDGVYSVYFGGDTHSTIYYRAGLKHNENGPAVLSYNNGKLEARVWYVDGQFIKDEKLEHNCASADIDGKVVTVNHSIAYPNALDKTMAVFGFDARGNYSKFEAGQSELDYTIYPDIPKK